MVDGDFVFEIVFLDELADFLFDRDGIIRDAAGSSADADGALAAFAVDLGFECLSTGGNLFFEDFWG